MYTRMNAADKQTIVEWKTRVFSGAKADCRGTDFEFSRSTFPEAVFWHNFWRRTNANEANKICSEEEKEESGN